MRVMRHVVDLNNYQTCEATVESDVLGCLCRCCTLRVKDF